MQTKKLVNDPDRIIDEMIEGVLCAHSDHLQRLVHPRALGAPRGPLGPREGKVGLVIGGGSGHEPSFLGFVGKGLADAVAIGNVFASPPPDPILDCARHASGDAGVLFMYGNYAGDVMNFDMAAEMAAAHDITVRTVITTDDVASAPAERRDERRGVAGNFFSFKAAGAACDRLLDLDECERLARKANAHTYTMGVGLSPCSLPQTRTPNFSLGENEMEIGLGIHGEPGVRRGPLESADAVTDQLIDAILEDMAPERGERVAVLVNSLGSTPPMELYVVNRRVHARLHDAGIDVHANWVGGYCTALEMGGVSITLHRLDEELGALLDHPCDAAMFRAGRSPERPRRGPTTRTDRPEAAPAGAQGAGAAPALAPRPPGDDVLDNAALKAAFTRIHESMSRHRDHLCALDGVIGDADHGVTMLTGFRAVNAATVRIGDDDAPTELLTAAAEAFLDAVGASSGPLYATALLRAAASARDQRALDAAGAAGLIEAMAGGISARGKSDIGDKTMYDAWQPAAAAATEAAGTAGASVGDVLRAAAAAADRGARDTIAMQARKGRSAKLGERSIGHMDAGAASTSLMLHALADIDACDTAAAQAVPT